MTIMKYALLTATAAIAMLFAACGDDDESSSSTATPATVTASPTTATASPLVTANTPTPSPIDVCGVNPDPATSTEVQVTSPVPGDLVTSPLHITGQIAVFEAQFNIAIKDAAGNDIVAVPGHSQEGQTLAPFSETVPFTVTTATPACVWVYDISEATGNPSMVFMIPVTLQP